MKQWIDIHTESVLVNEIVGHYKLKLRTFCKGHDEHEWTFI